MILVNFSFARIVEIEVHGMTCAFCVDSLTRKFEKMSDVNEVKVSLKLKKILLQTSKDKPTLDALNKVVLDAGFTPVKIEIKKI